MLCLAYAVPFGSELVVVSMLPGFFAETFGLSPVVAGAAASAVSALVAAIAGRWLVSPDGTAAAADLGDAAAVQPTGHPAHPDTAPAV